jgi:hypothetical protein
VISDTRTFVGGPGSAAKKNNKNKFAYSKYYVQYHIALAYYRDIMQKIQYINSGAEWMLPYMVLN